MLFNFQPPTVKHGEVMTERQIREYLYKLVDNLTLVLNNIDSENMAQGATGSTEALSKEIAALRIRINKLSGEIADTDVSEFQSTLNSLTARMNEAEAALGDKQEKLVSSTNIKTVNGTSILGSGNIVTPTYDDTALAGRVSSLETASSSLSSQLSSLQTAVSALEAALSGKADASSVEDLASRVTAAENGIVTLESNKADKEEIPDIVEYRTVTQATFTNQIPISTDADGNIYNGIGYKTGYYLNSAGAEVEGSGVAVTGYIPVKKGDIIRIKETSQSSIDTSVTFTLTSAKAAVSNCGKTISNIQGNSVYGTITIDGNVATWDTSNISYYFWNNFAYLRATILSSDAIITVNEEISYEETIVPVLKPNLKVTKDNLLLDISEPILSGKTIAVFGDSIIGMVRDTTSVTVVMEEYTGAKVYNLGFGGCRMSVHPTSGYAAFSMWALADAITSGTYTDQEAQAASGEDYFAAQLETLKSIDFSSVDVIVIHYGTNDFYGNVAISNSTNATDTSTVCGALNYAINKILSTFPKIRIFVSLPIYRMWDTVGAETYTNTLGHTLSAYSSAMKGIAASYNLPIIDGYHSLGVNSANNGAFSSDGTHLNEYGRKVFGQYMGACIFKGDAATLQSDSSYDDSELRASISSLQSNKQDKLVSGTNIKTVNGTSILGNGDITTPTYDDTALASRVSTAETNITTLQKSATRADSLDTETHLSSTISATATAATEYVLTFDKAYTNMPVVSALIYNSSPKRYFGLLSLILTGYVTDSSGNYTGVNFKICNNHTSALNVRIRSTVIGFK